MASELNPERRHLALLAELRAQSAASNHCFGPAVLVFLAAKTQAQAKTLKSQFIKEAEHRFRYAKLDWAKYQLLVKDYADELARSELSVASARGRKTPHNIQRSTPAHDRLEAELRKDRQVLKEAMARIPSSIDKALRAAAFWMEDDESTESVSHPDLVQAMASVAPELVTAQRKRIHLLLLAGTELSVMTNGRLEWEVALLRHLERFELQHAKVLITGLCDDLDDELREAVSQVYERSRSSDPPPNLLAPLRMLWTASFSQRMRARVEPLAGSVLDKALTWQLPEGGIEDHRTPDKPSAEVTAYATNCLQRYDDGARWRVGAEKGIQWLLGNQTDLGGWGTLPGPGDTKRLNVGATVAALDALRIAGIDLDHPTIARAEGSLIAAQAIDGMWRDGRGNVDEHRTALVIGYFQRRNQRLGRMPASVEIGRGLLLKSQAMQAGAYTTDQILALIALYHGLEYVVYGFLTTNSKTIRRPDGRTIGLDEGLSQFRALAREKGWIRATSELPFMTEIGEMKAQRDEVVHRMRTTNADAVQRFSMAVWKLVERFDVPALGYALLE